VPIRLIIPLPDFGAGYKRVAAMASAFHIYIVHTIMWDMVPAYFVTLTA
jgi:hypothetical protein